jgi:hypothetical protein
MKLLWLTAHPWGPSFRSSADFMDAYWATTAFFAHSDRHTGHSLELQDDKFAGLVSGRHFDGESIWSFVPYSF